MALVIILAAAAGFGWLRPTSVSPSSTASTTITQSLVDAAKAEGTMTIYGNIESTTFLNAVTAFEKVYPWAQVNYVSLAASDLESRVSSEYSAGKVTADLLNLVPSVLTPLIKEGAVQPYCDPMVQLMNYSAGTYDTNCYWTEWGSYYNVIIYNTKLVNASDAPITLQDLANPKWSGKVAFQNPAVLSGSSSIFIGNYDNLGNASWVSLMNSIAANKPIVTSSGGQAFTDVLSGTALVGIDLQDDYVAAIQQGQPIAGTVTGYTLPYVFAITKGAPHPAMAELFEQWSLSASGQEAALFDESIPPAFNGLLALDPSLQQIIPQNITIHSLLTSGAYGNDSSWFVNVLHSDFG